MCYRAGASVIGDVLGQLVDAACRLFALEPKQWTRELDSPCGRWQVEILAQGAWSKAQTASRAPEILTVLWRDALMALRTLFAMVEEVSSFSGMEELLEAAMTKHNFVRTCMQRVNAALPDTVTVSAITSIWHDMTHSPRLIDLFGVCPTFVAFMLRACTDPAKAAVLSGGCFLTHLRRNEFSPPNYCRGADPSGWFEEQVLECVLDGKLSAIFALSNKMRKTPQLARTSPVGDADAYATLHFDVPVWCLASLWTMGYPEPSLKRVPPGTCGDRWVEQYVEMMQQGAHNQRMVSHEIKDLLFLLRNVCIDADADPVCDTTAVAKRYARSATPAAVTIHEDEFTALGIEPSKLWSGMCLKYTNDTQEHMEALARESS